jgi:murein DD-endopeptidase MepM/ murein hydrolase activator NlpD
VPLAADGSVAVGNLAGAVDVVVDVLGWVPTGAPGVAIVAPSRVLDTRDGDALGAGSTVDVVAPFPARAAGATALVANLTVTGASAATFVSIDGTETSSVNTVRGRTAANLAVLPLDGAGRVTLRNHAGTADLVVDVLGWFGAGGGFTSSGPARLVDTRVARAVPVAAGTNASWVGDHHNYPATDIFAACGAVAVSPVTGTVVHVRRDDRYVRGADNPALRGGRSVAVLGDDGVRYYMSHFQSVDSATVVGARVVAGQRIAVVGASGDAGACHIHFGLSPNCPQLEWSVRRGVIWPYPYLDAWRAGRSGSPAAEIAAWSAAHPDACAVAAADPYAPDAG